MGEAIYYGKLFFDTKENAAASFETFGDLCVEFCKSDRFWQKNRGISFLDNDETVPMTDEEFWTQFETIFPNVAEYLKGLGSGRHGYGESPWGVDRRNGLAGLLEPIGREDDVSNIYLVDNQIWWSSEVWHFADWDPFIRYAVNKLPGCESGRYMSDEYADLFDLV